MLVFVGVKHSRLFVRECPVLVESADPFFKRGLGLLSFGTFPLQEQRKVQKTIIDLTKPHSNTLVSKTNINLTPNGYDQNTPRRGKSSLPSTDR